MDKALTIYILEHLLLRANCIARRISCCHSQSQPNSSWDWQSNWLDHPPPPAPTKTFLPSNIGCRKHLCNQGFYQVTLNIFIVMFYVLCLHTGLCCVALLHTHTLSVFSVYTLDWVKHLHIVMFYLMCVQTGLLGVAVLRTHTFSCSVFSVYTVDCVVL